MATSRTVQLALYCTGCIPGYQLPCFAGSAARIYERHGLNVRIVDPEPGPANILAVADGSYDLCLTSVAHFLNAKRQRPQLEAKFVFMLARQSHMAAFVVEGRVAEHGRPIATYADLDGASLLGAADSAFVKEYVALLARLDGRPGRAVELPYGEIMNALAEGRGDIAADFVDLLPRFQQAADPLGVSIQALPFHAAGIDIYGSGLVAGRKLLEDEPELLATAVEAFREAVIVSRDDPEVGLEGLIAHIPDADPGLALAGWRAGAALMFDDTDVEIGSMRDEKWRRTITFHADAYGSSPDVDPRSVFDMPAQVHRAAR